MAYDRIVYLFLILLISALFVKERLSLGCSHSFFEQCENQNGVAVVGTKSNQSDTTEEILQKVSLAGDYTSRFVTWRRNAITSFVVILGLWGLVLRRMPSGWEAITGMLIVFLIITSIDGFYKFHLYDVVAKNINSSVSLLRKRT